jgi:hypothetical protein
MPDQNTPAAGFQFGLANLKPAEPLEKITLTFPDGAKREFPKDITGLDVAKGISPSLAWTTTILPWTFTLLLLTPQGLRATETVARHALRFDIGRRCT